MFRSLARGAPADLAFSGPLSDAVVADGPLNLSLALIDQLTGAVNTVQLAGGSSVFGIPGSGGGTGSPRVAVGPSGIWVARPDRLVGLLDTSANELVHPLLISPPHDERSDSFFSAIAVGERGVWVAGDPNDRALWRIDPATGRLAATIRLPVAPTDVAVGAGAVWVTSELDDTLSRIDPSTNEVTGTIAAGKGASGVAVGAGSVWVADAVAHAVSRIDPRTLRVIRTIAVGSSPSDVAVGNGVVWVAARRP